MSERNAAIGPQSDAQLYFLDNRPKPRRDDDPRMIPTVPLDQVSHFPSHDFLVFVATICGTQTGLML